MSEWISVREQMPEEGINVLVYGDLYYKRKGIDVDHVDKSGNFFCYDKRKVEYWMPLPVPPMPKEDDSGVDQDRG